MIEGVFFGGLIYESKSEKEKTIVTEKILAKRSLDLWKAIEKITIILKITSSQESLNTSTLTHSTPLNSPEIGILSLSTSF